MPVNCGIRIAFILHFKNLEYSFNERAYSNQLAVDDLSRNGAYLSVLLLHDLHELIAVQRVSALQHQ